MSEAKGVLFSLGQFLNQFLDSDCVYTFSILTVYMFCMFSILTVYTFCMFSILTVYTLSILTVYMFCMFSILTVYTLSILTVYMFCMFSILTVYTLSILTVYPLSILTVYLTLLLLFSDFLSDECSCSNRCLYNGLFQTCSDGVTPPLSWSVVNLTLSVE